MAAQRPEYVIEHMEEDDPDSPCVFPQWALLEYRHMLQLVGPGSTVHFTSLSHASLDSLRQSLSAASPTPQSNFELHTASITTLMEQRGIAKREVCLLDPKAPYAVSVTDAGKLGTAHEGGPFRFFLYGGILGDDPPRDRTSSLRQLGFPSRHLGGVQMTTDTALGVTKRCVEDGLRLALPDTLAQERAWADDQLAPHTLTWVNHPDLQFGKGESVSPLAAKSRTYTDTKAQQVQMPFRYMADSAGAPLMPDGMRALIKRDLDRSFEF